MPSVSSSGASNCAANSCFALAPAPLGEIARHADHLEAAVLEVVGLLGVEREDAVGEGFVRGDERRDLLESEHLGGGQAMAAVGRPQPPVLAAHHDQGIQKRRGLLDRHGQALGVRRRQVALEGRRLHGRERQARQQQRPPAERLAIGADRRAAGGAHQLREFGDRRIIERHGDLRGIEAALPVGPGRAGRACGGCGRQPCEVRPWRNLPLE